MTLEGTPTIVTPVGRRRASTSTTRPTRSNALVPHLEAQGIDDIVVLLHEGGVQAAGGTYNDCTGITGPIVDIVDRIDPAVDVVICGHTHQAYNCVINGIPVTSAVLVRPARHRHRPDRSTGRPRRSPPLTVNNRIVTRDVAAGPARSPP